MLLPSVLVVWKRATSSLLRSRYSSCSFISATVLLRLSENHGDSFLAQSLQRFPSSSLRLPKSPIFSPHISQYFLSKSPI